MTPDEAHQCNVDALQRELDQRAAEGEDVSHLRVFTGYPPQIVRVSPLAPGAFAQWDNPCPRRGF